MAWRKIEDSKLKAIANAIREMTGKSWTMSVAAMPALIKTIGALEINNPTVGSINAYMFYECSALKSIICSSAKDIGNCAFQSCEALTTANFPAVTAAGDRAFCYCRKLTTVNFPSLKGMGNSMFDSCNALERAEFPNVTSIGSYALAYTTKLKALILSGSTVVTLASTDAFTSSAIARGTGYIYVPDNLVSTYKKATNWSVYASQIRPISELKG